MRRASAFTVLMLIGLAFVAANVGLRFNPNSATMESAVMIQPCPECGAGIFPDEDSLRAECPKCGHVITVRNRWNPLQGTPEEQPNSD